MKRHYIIRGNTYRDMKSYDRAITDYSKAIEMNPSVAEPYIERADAFLGKGDTDMALQDFNKAADIDPDNENVYIKRGYLYLKVRKYPSDALKDFEKAIEINPNCSVAYKGKADVMIVTNETRRPYGSTAK